jgi:hypothetical protein
MLKIILLTIFAIYINAVNLEEKTSKIIKITNNTAIINMGNLKIGQTGIVIHKFKNKKSIILAKATIISSSDDNSVIEFSNKDILEQTNLANTNLKPQENDIFLLNHMYDVSLLIVPNFEIYKNITSNYKNNFINSDIFAAYLKINNNPFPKKEDFIKFCKKHTIGTIYIIISSNLYILDGSNFTLLKIENIEINNKQFQVPFYTNIKDIEKSFFNFSSKEKIDNYDNYYKKILGIK